MSRLAHPSVSCLPNQHQHPAVPAAAAAVWTAQMATMINSVGNVIKVCRVGFAPQADTACWLQPHGLGITLQVQVQHARTSEVYVQERQ